MIICILVLLSGCLTEGGGTTTPSPPAPTTIPPTTLPPEPTPYHPLPTTPPPTGDTLDDLNVFNMGDTITEEQLNQIFSKKFADIDGDGQEEVIFSPNSREARIYIAERERANYKISWKSKSLCYSYEFSCNTGGSNLRVFDFDNDGDLEIGVVYTEPLQSFYFVYLINPTTKEYELEVRDARWIGPKIPDEKRVFHLGGSKELTEIYEKIIGFEPP